MDAIEVPVDVFKRPLRHVENGLDFEHCELEVVPVHQVSHVAHEELIGFQLGGETR